MSVTNLEDNILQAIDIISSKKISNAGYDKTIQATIVSCQDQTIGKYKVRYQDGMFYAYSNNTDVTYPINSLVYIFVPNGDFSKQKIILGTTSQLGINYVNIISGDEAYAYAGGNCIVQYDQIALSSYAKNSIGKSRYEKVIYKYGSSNNFISIDNNTFLQEMYGSTSLICGGYIRTTLKANQRMRGNYGIVFKLIFTDKNKQQVQRFYTLDVNKMTGSPYNYPNSTRQYAIFDYVDGQNFIRVDEVTLFTQNFPENKDIITEQDYDIFFKDIELYGSNKLSEEELGSYALVIQPSKIVFLQGDAATDTRKIQAEMRIKGKTANASQNIKYYWFIEDASVVNDSPYYCQYGGRGWKCLNSKNTLKAATQTQTAVYEWLPMSGSFTFVKKDILSSSINYKCVAIYDNIVIKKEFTVQNKSGIVLSIKSDSGTQFFYDTGSPTLTCKINGIEDSINYTYVWSVLTSDGDFNLLIDEAKQTQYNVKMNQYEDLLNQYNSQKAALEAKTVLKTSGERQLRNLESRIVTIENQMADLTAANVNAVVYKNKVLNIPIKNIVNYNIFKCSVWMGDSYIGTASLLINNDLNKNFGYSLIINDGTVSFKYNEQGISPTSVSLTNPITIKALSFSIYDPYGREVVNSADVENINKQVNLIKWQMPAINSMLDPVGVYQTIGSNYVFNSSTLIYKIKSGYDISKKRNNILLTVDYQGISLVAETNFTFIKQGEAGTNGTDYVCKIEPWVRNNTDIPYYPTIYIDKNGDNYNFTDDDYHFNFYTQNHSGRWFRLKLFHNDELVYCTDGTVTKMNVTVTWSVVANKYSSSVSDIQAIRCVNAATGQFAISPDALKNTHAPACVIKAEVKYNNVTEYTYLPIVFSVHENNFNINLNEYTGFNMAVYTGDGRQPIYDNAAPHTLTVTELIAGEEEDITDTNTDYELIYNWNLLGSTCWSEAAQRIMNTWNDSATALRINNISGENLSSYQYRCKPIDNYTSLCVTNSVRCIITQNGAEIGRIIMPVHLMLNQYGSARLNVWDGNSIQIDNDGGVILAPQVGAGKKNNDNTFTGVLMGQIKQNESGLSKTYTGLIGLSRGRRNIYLDAQTGNATFGVVGQGQIQLIPDGTSTIAGWKINADSFQSNDNLTTLYANESHGGQRFNINNKFIVYTDGRFSAANNKFAVDANGVITATGGTIGGWTIESNSLHTSGKSNFGVGNGAYLGANGTLDFSSANGNYLRYDGTNFGINIGRNNFFNVNRNSITLGDFVIDDQYGRNAFRSDSGDCGISTQPDDGGFWIWCGSESDRVEDQAFAVNTGGQAYAYDFCPINLRNINRPFSGYSNSNGSIVLEIRNLWDAIKNHGGNPEQDECRGGDCDDSGDGHPDGGCVGSDYGGYTCSHSACNHNACGPTGD